MSEATGRTSVGRPDPPVSKVVQCHRERDLLRSVGGHADVTLVNFSAETSIDGRTQPNAAGYSLYDGMRSALRIVGTIPRWSPASGFFGTA